MNKIIMTVYISISLLFVNCFGVFGGMQDFLKETKGLKKDIKKSAKKDVKEKMKNQIKEYQKQMKKGWSSSWPLKKL